MRVVVLIEISMLGLHGVGGQQHGGLWGAVNVIVQDSLLHLQEEESLCGVLDQLLSHVLWVELCSEFDQQWVLLPYILCCDLMIK